VDELLLDVLEDDGQAGEGDDLRDAGAHEARADDARLVDVAHYAASTTTAAPWPPPTQSVATPRSSLRRRSSLSKVKTMRTPVKPTGWPSAIAPPLTFVIAGSKFMTLR